MIRICGNWGNTMADIIIKQSSFYNDAACRDAVGVIESKYTYTDETEYFGRLVNFSTAKTEPYQRWVRYREGYSTSLVNDLIQRAGISRDKHFIADPMVGSGSTMISACRNGFDSFGVDVNPFCQLIVTTKLLAPEEKDLCEIEVFLKSLPEKYQTKPVSNPPLSEYFPPQNLVDLLQLREEIDAVSDDTVKQILTACWFFILESCSNRKKDGNGLATRPAPVTNVISRFRSVMNEMISDYREYPFTNDTKSKIYTGSACNFSEYSGGFEAATGKKLGAIIFSPPYANAFDYFESYKMELLFGQLYSPDAYQMHKKEQIRNYRISYGQELHCGYPAVELLCNAVYEAVPKKEAATGKRDARTRLMPNMLRGYFTDMGRVLSELYQALDVNGCCYIVVDQSAYVGVIVPTDVLIADIAEGLGFDVESIIVCRKASTSVQQRKAYSYLGTTLRESIVCLKK